MKGSILKLKENVLPHRNLHVQDTNREASRDIGSTSSIDIEMPFSTEREALPKMSPPNKVPKVTFLKSTVAGPSKDKSSSTSNTDEDKTFSTFSSEGNTSIGSLDEDLWKYENSQKTATRRKSTIQVVESNSKFYLGLPQEIYILVHFITENESIIYRDVLITLKKIRLDDAYFRLATDFGVSTSTIQRTFTSSVAKIANILQNFIFFPTKQQIKRLLPIPFRYRFSNVQYIIDCFEVEINKPSNPLHQSHTWSDYKKCNTIKFLVSSTPSGFINFISKGFGGRITDKEIISASGFLDHLEDCCIMADRGFKHIAPLLYRKHCELIRPPSVEENVPLNAGQVKEAKRIASLRIHIERVIKRIREFKMLRPHACVSLSLLQMLNEIAIIVCALVNVQKPLIK